jgi:hypothetical protein
MFGTLAILGPKMGSLLAQEKKEGPPPMALKVGDEAPDFTLRDQTFKNQVTLHDFRGKKNVALAFYIFAFTGG